MSTAHEQPKKQFCARCFLPVENEDKVDIEGQKFHRMCSMCCVCRTLPTSVKMFYGHVFCGECFKVHVLARFKGESPRIHSNSWWMQWAPGMKPQEGNSETKEEPKSQTSEEPEPTKRCVCARCLQTVDPNNKIDVEGQSFHSQCARCYYCQTTPKSNLKIYYGQVFCENCFHRHVLSQNKDNPSEFFRQCFDQWQNNPQFAENMKEFMSGSHDATPSVFLMQGSQPPFCRCGAAQQEWFQNNESKKSATYMSIGEESQGTWDLSYENRTEVSDVPESCDTIEDRSTKIAASAAEKIEKLTKYLHGNWEKSKKKWEKFNESVVSFEPSVCGWIDLHAKKTKSLDCPKCLWQCGSIYVRDGNLKKGFCDKVYQ